MGRKTKTVYICNKKTDLNIVIYVGSLSWVLLRCIALTDGCIMDSLSVEQLSQL